MPLFNIVLLSLIQGITEFLPISSSGHLALFPMLTGTEDQGLALDVAVHVGSLVAVVAYFRADAVDTLRGARDLALGREITREARLTRRLAVATAPVLLFGLALALSGEIALLRDVRVIAWTTLVFGVILWAADRFGPQLHATGDWRYRHAAFMGLAQTLALIPGVSRSGITITAARAMGYRRVEAARLSMLMAMPTILAAGGLATVDMIRRGDVQLGLDMALAAALSCVSAFLALALMMRMLRSWSLTPFVVYRVLLGLGLLAWSYG